MAETTTDITPQVEETEQSNSAEAESTEQVETESTDVAEEECIREEILDKEEMKKIFVGGIPLDCTDEELKEFFETISGGIVTDNVIIRKDSDKTKKSYFGFVTFDTCELVDEVLLKRDQLKIKDKQLDVNRAVPKDNQSPGAHEKTKKLFIANLPKTDCTEEQLMKYFNKRHPCKNYGVIESIQLIKKKGEDGKPTEENKGFGFITVSTEDFADKLAIQHSKFEFGGRKIDLKKSVNESKGSRGGRGGRGGGGGPMYANQGYGGFGGYGGYGGYGGWDGYGPGFGGGYDYYGGYGGGAGGFQQRRKGGGQGGRFTPY